MWDEIGSIDLIDNWQFSQVSEASLFRLTQTTSLGFYASLVVAQASLDQSLEIFEPQTFFLIFPEVQIFRLRKPPCFLTRVVAIKGRRYRFPLGITIKIEQFLGDDLEHSVDGGVWNPASLGANIIASGEPYSTPGYRKDSLGIVYLRGNAVYVGGGIETILNLPVGFRPTEQIRFLLPAKDANGIEAFCWCDMKTNGNLDYVNGNVSTISFDQISFATY